MPDISEIDQAVKEHNFIQQVNEAAARVRAESDAARTDDIFNDDTPLACGIEDPEHCDGCQ